ncbi:MAG: SURF1 family protein [Alphaproteobacteria bacterium]|nr:SURF1 family protein [Alphaproteobacteria bacterium]
MQFRKLELLPTLFFIASFVVLCALGTWQLQRLAWKESIIAASEARRHLPILAGLPEDTGDLVYRKAALTGRFLYDHTIHLIGRQQGMNVGYYMVTPFALDDDGRVILVNRGFSPLGKETKPAGLVTVSGVFRPLRQKRYFAPENVPEKNIWTYEDLDKIGEMVGQRPLPLVLEVIGQQEKNVFPIPDDGKIIFQNNHLGYAITWFALAVTSVVMFGAYYRKK